MSDATTRIVPWACSQKVNASIEFVSLPATNAIVKLKETGGRIYPTIGLTTLPSKGTLVISTPPDEVEYAQGLVSLTVKVTFYRLPYLEGSFGKYKAFNSTPSALCDVLSPPNVFTATVAPSERKPFNATHSNTTYWIPEFPCSFEAYPHYEIDFTGGVLPMGEEIKVLAFDSPDGAPLSASAVAVTFIPLYVAVAAVALYLAYGVFCSGPGSRKKKH